MVYRAAPVTQRDGSSLANSNCRMASIATGIDFHTLGGTKSTGKAMRARQPDQSGGTDSGDAKAAWNSYSEALRVRDGSLWGDCLSDLNGGRLVHLDVWHATVGGPCLSGSGGYGHTMAVAPENRISSGVKQWLVADPWCSPPKWSWTNESKLKAGAEKWGGQVFTQATAGQPGPIDPDILRLLMAIAARDLMQRFRPGQEATEDPPDTGGSGGKILFTTTKSQTTATGGDEAVGIYYNCARWTVLKDDTPVYLDASTAKVVTHLKKGAVVTSLGVKAVVDADGKDSNWKAIPVKTGGLVPGDSPTVPAILWVRSADLSVDSLPTSQAWDDSIWALFGTPDGRFPCADCPECPDCPDCPDCPEVPDCNVEVAAAIAARDLVWEQALMTGNAWPTEVP